MVDLRTIHAVLSVLMGGQLVGAGELIWDFGPESGAYHGCYTNITSQQNFADDVVFPDFMEITGIDIWSCAQAPAGNLQIKILHTDPFTNVPGSDYLRCDAEPDRYAFHGIYGGVELYKVSVDFEPVQLRANTRYWIGVSGNNWSLGQATVDAPGDGEITRFSGREFTNLGSFGDQMFQLRGRVVAPPFELSLEGVCPGEMTASVIGATPGGEVAFIYGRCGGETTLPPGSPCPGAILPVGQAALVNIIRADSEGNATLSGEVPDSVCGQICLVALDLASCEVSTFARTYDRPELYTGATINETLGFSDFNWLEPGFNFDACFDDNGMHFTRAHIPCADNAFRGYIYCGGDGTPSVYMSAVGDMMSISRVDGETFDAIEFTAGDGYVANCTIAYLWIRAYLDGTPIADFTIDQPVWEPVGLRGGVFDEIRIGAYAGPLTRNQAYETGNERTHQALAIDNVRFGAIDEPGALELTLTGACPGTMTAEATGATPGGQVAFIRGACDEQTTIPGGPCAGTVLPIGAPQIVATITADQTGAARITGDLAPAACGGRICLAALDLATCGVSNPSRIE